MTPRPRTTPDEWGARNRTYPVTAGLPGPRRPELTPYVVAPGRAVHGRTHKRVVLVCGSQMGKSESTVDIIGERFDTSPVPTLYVGPTRQFLAEQWEPRIEDLLDNTPLRTKVARGKKWKQTRKLISGVPLRLAHAGSSSALKSDSFGLAITDEADELMANVKGQGDPIRLTDRRGDTYADFVHYVTSTPGAGPAEVELDEASGLQFWKDVDPAEVASTIWRLWLSGTRYHWAWPCPHCDEFFIPRFAVLHWAGDGSDGGPKVHDAARARDTAHLLCPSCGAEIRDDEGGTVKAAMNARGVYVAPGQRVSAKGRVTGAAPDSWTLSYWVSGLASPFVSWGDRAASYVEAKRSGQPGDEQAVLNGSFGEVWAPVGGDAPEWAEVKACAAPYRMGDVPEGVLFATAGVDVQGRKLVYVVRGWGLRQESWLLDAGELHGSGDTRLDDVWSDLDALIAGDYGGLPIRRVFIDSGYRPDEAASGQDHKVYEFCRRHPRLCYPTKGFDKRTQPIAVSRIDVKPRGGKPKYGLDLVLLDSDVAKTWVHGRVRWPKGEPGGWHLPEDVTAEYCRQIVNETRLRKPDGGWTWVPRGPRDFLDAEALAYCAARMLGLDRLQDTTARATRAAIPAPPPAPSPAAPSPRAAARPRDDRMSGSGWLSGRTSGWLDR